MCTRAGCSFYVVFCEFSAYSFHSRLLARSLLVSFSVCLVTVWYLSPFFPCRQGNHLHRDSSIRARGSGRFCRDLNLFSCHGGRRTRKRKRSWQQRRCSFQSSWTADVSSQSRLRVSWPASCSVFSSRLRCFSSCRCIRHTPSIHKITANLSLSISLSLSLSLYRCIRLCFFGGHKRVWRVHLLAILSSRPDVSECLHLHIWA